MKKLILVLVVGFPMLSHAQDDLIKKLKTIKATTPIKMAGAM